ncbi:MAG: membrane protein insertase YidC [Bacteroidales bacterium]|nr:membrane protein insertase YidC [Bacteroidales bacterium]
MNRKSIIGLILIFGIFVGYMWWIAPSKEEIAERQRINDSIRTALADSIRTADSIASVKARLDSLAAQGDTMAQRQLQMNQRGDMGAFNASTYGDTIEVTVKNEKMCVSLSNMGAQVREVVLNDFTTFDKRPLQLISPADDNMNLVFSTEDNHVVNTRDLVFVPYRKNGSKIEPITSSTDIELSGEDSTAIIMRAYVGDSNGVSKNCYLEFAYGFKGDEYDVDFDINTHGLAKIIRSSDYMDFEWHNKMNRQEKVDASTRGSKNRNKDPEKFYSSIYYKAAKDDVDEVGRGRDADKNIKTSVEWVAFKQQFFCAILVADSTFTNADLSQVTDKENKDANYLCDMSGTIGLAYDNEHDCTMGMNFYFGPTKFRDLRAMHRGFEKMLPLGWWIFSRFVSRWLIIPTFNFLETFNWNYGIIIIVFTFLLRLVLFPLTFKSYQGSAIMRILKPEMDALNKKYPNPEDAMAKSREMTALQKKAGYNPLSGCLPILIQMPILTAMFMFYPSAIELRQKHFLWCDDLSTYDSILDLGFNIPLYGDHVSLFCLLMFGMQFFYTWYTMRSQSGQATMPGMKFMMYFMPFMMLFMFNSMAAGVNLYYFFSLSLTMLQMILIRKFTSEKKIRARMAAYDAKNKNAKKGPQKKSKFQQRLEEMQKMTEEMQKQQNRR